MRSTNLFFSEARPGLVDLQGWEVPNEDWLSKCETSQPWRDNSQHVRQAAKMGGGWVQNKIKGPKPDATYSIVQHSTAQHSTALQRMSEIISVRFRQSRSRLKPLG